MVHDETELCTHHTCGVYVYLSNLLLCLKLAVEFFFSFWGQCVECVVDEEYFVVRKNVSV